VILLDSGPVIAAASRNDQRRDQCQRALSELREPAMMSVLCVTEVCYFLGTRGTAAGEAAFLRSIAAGTIEVVDLTSDDYRRTADLVERYGDLPLGAADASVVALAERLDIARVMTLDENHFRIVRPRHIDVFELLP
jgi:uncharacterized protein